MKLCFCSKKNNKQKHNKKLKQEIENDICINEFDKYYEQKAIRYLISLLGKYKHKLPDDMYKLDDIMKYVNQLGLLQPFADNILYLKNMKKII